MISGPNDLAYNQALYDDLDQHRDRTISRAESRRFRDLDRRWENYDRDTDNQLDQIAAR